MTRLTLIPLLVLSLAASADSADESYRFRVLLDDREIGHHEFHIDRQPTGAERVRIDADFDVRILRIPIYSYRHSNEEIWSDGCLQRLESYTDDNGAQSRIRAAKTIGSLSVERNGERISYASECPRSFAYWNRDIVTSSRLLNAQTGKLVEVDIQPLADRPDVDSLDPDRLQGYRISAADDSLDISVWYDRESGRWVALESILDNNRVLRYVPEREVAS